MDELLNKINKLKKLKEERTELIREIKQKENHSILNKLLLKKNMNFENLFNFVKANDLCCEDVERVKNRLMVDLKEHLQRRNQEGAKCCLEILLKLKEEKEKLISIFKECLDNILVTTNRLKTPLRITILETIKMTDETNQLGLFSHFERVETEVIKELIDNVDESPKGLDKFLNELVEVRTSSDKFTGLLDEVYTKFEKLYFEKAMAIIKKDEKNAMEDVVYVVHKIRKRNNLMGQNLFDYIKSSVYDLHILKTEEDYSFFEKMFC